MLEFLELQNILVAWLLIVLLLWILQRPKHHNLPPGPRGLPLVGSIFTLGKYADVAENLKRLRKKYNSDIIYMKLGNIDTVVLFNLELVQKAFSSDQFEARPDIFLNRIANNHGIIASSGSRWKHSRRFSISVLRDFGMGKNRIAEVIQEEVYHLCEEFENFQGKPFSPKVFLHTAVANVICSINFGKRFEYGDVTFDNMVSVIIENEKLLSKAHILNFAPWLRFLPGDIFGFHRIMQNFNDSMNYIQKQVEEHRLTFDEQNIRDIIDAFIKEQKTLEKSGNKELLNIFSDKQILHIISDIFIAGTETTTNSLRWLLLATIVYPDIQEKVQTEIDSVVPRGRRPTTTDKPKLPYTVAVIRESLRFFQQSNFGVPHSNPKPTKLKGYDIPANTLVMFSRADILSDPNRFPNPGKFDPCNFLDADGNLVNRENYIPFSIGKRSCPGESMARMEMFLTFATLLQKFSIQIDETNVKPDFTPVPGFILSPTDYKIVAKIRE